MKKHIISLSIVSFCSMSASDVDPNAADYHYGYAANQIRSSTVIFQKTVLAAPKIASEVGEQVVSGALKKFDKEKQKELGANIMRGALTELSSSERQQVAYDFTKGALEATGAVIAGGATAAVAAAKTSTIAAVSAAKTSTIAAVSAAKTSTIAAASTAKAATIAGATAAAPYVAVAAVVGVVGYGSYKTHRHFAEPVEQYHRCLNDNLGCDDLNDRGFPKVCDSLGSGAWNYLGTKSTRESNYKELKARLQAAKEKESC